MQGKLPATGTSLLANLTLRTLNPAKWLAANCTGGLHISLGFVGFWC